MEKTTRRLCRFVSIMVILALLLSCNLVFAAPQEGEDTATWEPSRVVKVGFVPLDGMSNRDSKGNMSGLIIDYLYEIAKYTNWQYEFIEASSDDLLSRFEAGEFDLIGGQFYLEGYEESYVYPKYSMGSSRSALFCRNADSSIKSYELESLNGKTIGVFQLASERIRRLEQFLQINDLSCELKYYSVDDMVDGSLHHILEQGQVDLLLGNDREVNNQFRLAASFAGQPYYIVTQPGNEALIDSINMSIEKILDSDPDFHEEKYDANFTDVMSSIKLNSAELDFIVNNPVLTVAVVPQSHPFHCIGNGTDHHNGIIPDMLASISDFSGLKFTYVNANTYAEAVQMVQDGRADLMGHYLDVESTALEQGLVLTKSYISLNSIPIRHKGVNYPEPGLTFGILNGRVLPETFEYDTVTYFQNSTDGLKAVNRGDIDVFYGLSTRLEQELQAHRYINVIPLSQMSQTTDVAFALARPANLNLLTILNKSINSLTPESRQSMLDQNLVSMGYSSLTMTEWIYANPVAFITIITAFLALFMIAFVIITRIRIKGIIVQNELIQAQVKSTAKSNFLSRMSHEIRTPINAIVGLANLTCMAEPLPVELKNNLNKILSSSQYLVSLINDILDMSRIESGRLEIESELFSLNGLIEEMDSMMRTQAEAKKLNFVIERSIQHSWIIGDPVRLRQILINLLSNAIKFTPEGKSITLLIRELDCQSQKTTLHFTVLDEGIGIPLESQDKIFEMFEQLGTSTSKSVGTGLGLPICRSIVEAMGGTLYLKSAPGEGSEFTFQLTFPLGSEPDIEKATKRESKKSEREDDDALTLEGIHILLAEDNDLNAEIARRLLEMNGALVRRAVNGQETVDQFLSSQEGEFHLILMDIRMPIKDGLEATRDIRASNHPQAKTIPIVAMTANSFKDDSDAAMEAGMSDFVSKPFNVKHLNQLLLDLLDKKTP